MRKDQLLMAVALFAACAGGDSTTPHVPDPPHLAKVTLSPDSVLLATVGATTTLQASGLDQFGAAFVAAIDWTSTRTDVATVAGGVVTARANGTALVVASSGGMADTSRVLVVIPPPPNQAPVATITSPATTPFTLQPATSITLRGTVTDPEDGKVVGTWSSSVATLGTGDELRLDSLSRGDHVFTLRGTDSKGLTGTATVTVRVPPDQGQDTRGPTLYLVDLIPDTLDVTGGATLAIEMDVGDDGSGVKQVGVILNSETSSQSHVVGLSLIGGNKYRGHWRGNHAFTSTAARGRWTLQIGLFDEAGNITSYLPGQWPIVLVLK